MLTAFCIGCVQVAIINPIGSAAAKQYNFVMETVFGETDKSELSVLTNGIWVRDNDATHNVIINGGSLEVQNSLIPTDDRRHFGASFFFSSFVCGGWGEGRHHEATEKLSTHIFCQEY